MISKAEVDEIEWRPSDFKGRHEYIIVKDYPVFTAEITEAINDHGEVSEFKGRKYRYFIFEGYKYWRIGGIINRACMHSCAITNEGIYSANRK